MFHIVPLLVSSRNWKPAGVLAIVFLVKIQLTGYPTDREFPQISLDAIGWTPENQPGSETCNANSNTTRAHTSTEIVGLCFPEAQSR
jgi:hypothetical protein